MKRKEYREAFKNFFILLLLALGLSVSGYLVVKKALSNKEKNNSVEQGEKVDGKLDKTQLAIKINSVITLEDYQSKGKFGIENKSNNIYDFVVVNVNIKMYKKWKIIYKSSVS